MASFRIPAFRRLVTRPLPTPAIAHRRWAQVHDVRYLATHGAQERVLAKYKEKLERKAKETGVKDVDELKAVYKEKIESVRKEAGAIPTPESLLESAQKSASSTAAPSTPPPFIPPPPPSAHPASKPPTDSKLPPGVKTLSSFIDVEKTLELPEKEVEMIWRLRHARNPQSLCAVMQSNGWETIYQNARRHPQFVLPIPREGENGQGAEIHFLQWTFPAENCATVLFTHLAEYQLRNEFAAPHTTVTFHSEMAEPKGLVLVQGNVVEGRGVSVDEGKWLLMCMQKFYGMQSEEAGGSRKKLLEMFSRGDGGFKVEELLDQAEKI
ncbi:putative f1f0 atp synthase assembly protein atp11 protein [Neofusicoccum parvum UCRNP2]|uniref:Putative f1f0 atp synthase assembly protein atp11 protein n=1 Tax=Botryosphaeria parva (strain UCR-NP2) TaxID=1287680 RepID=R1GR85_BOTPV|nr:putative f1f0 atp synthase assembly protein atp11 protein [Neofusicoccum parvum UCRNP2]